MSKQAFGRTLRLFSILTLLVGVSFAQSKTIAERLGYPADSKLLIILADDVGVYHAANLASFTALNQGAVTSGTVMQTSPWLTEVAAYAKQHPDISLGVHLTLSSEYNTYLAGARSRQETRYPACSTHPDISFCTVLTL